MLTASRPYAYAPATAILPEQLEGATKMIQRAITPFSPNNVTTHTRARGAW